MTDTTKGIRGLLVHNQDSLSERIRRRRWDMVLGLIPDLADLRVLDLGGTGWYWSRAPVRPRSVTVITLWDADQDAPGITMIEGDALKADRLMAGEPVDLVFSNSLMEHLGGHGPRRRFAEVVTALAPRYLVQTPYRYFPVEPHWMFPGFQFLPVRTRSYLAPRWPLGHTAGWDEAQARNEVMQTDLLSATELHDYFPEARIVWERVAGLPKSMLAFGSPQGFIPIPA